MSRIKDPVEKKRQSLKKDHRVFPRAGDKTFRSAWPKKKANANRRTRRSESAEVSKALKQSVTELDVPSVKRPKTLHKSAVVRLDQAITAKDIPIYARRGLKRDPR